MAQPRQAAHANILVTTPPTAVGLSLAEWCGQSLPQSNSSQTRRAPARIRSKMLTIVDPAMPENLANLSLRRSAWKQRSDDPSALRVTHPVGLSF